MQQFIEKFSARSSTALDFGWLALKRCYLVSIPIAGAYSAYNRFDYVHGERFRKGEKIELGKALDDAHMIALSGVIGGVFSPVTFGVFWLNRRENLEEARLCRPA
jgi:hypothetical protein